MGAETPTWEMLLTGLLVAGLLLWLMPGVRARLENTRKATPEDWRNLLPPLLAVILFVILLISLV